MYVARSITFHAEASKANINHHGTRTIRVIRQTGLEEVVEVFGVAEDHVAPLVEEEPLRGDVGACTTA
jgi:hypothetical protein